jgi:hypothetical protein
VVVSVVAGAGWLVRGGWCGVVCEEGISDEILTAGTGVDGCRSIEHAGG